MEDPRFDWEDKHIPSILAQLGSKSEMQPNVLFGDYNPSGKLTMSFPRNVDKF